MGVEELINEYRSLGISLWTTDSKLHFKSPAGLLDAGRKERLIKYKQEIIHFLNEQDKIKLISSPTEANQEFPMTDIQTAYLIGRNKAYRYGGIGCKVYAEFLTDFTDAKKLQQAILNLLERHQMLRAQMSVHGKQRINEQPIAVKLITHDLVDVSPHQQQLALATIRKQLQFKQYNPDSSHLFDFGLCQMTMTESILLFSLDMLIGDFVSIDIIMRDLTALYHYGKDGLEPLQLTFRDVMMYRQKEARHWDYQKKYHLDKEYWLNRIGHLPAGPELPTNESNEQINQGEFVKKELMMEHQQWLDLCQYARQYDLTPSSVVLTAYALVLSKWSQNKHFSLNITMLNRPPIHAQINDIIGDFTSNNILEITALDALSFTAAATQIQLQLFEDLEHHSFSGVEVLRELNRKNRDRGMVPFVFTSTVGAESDVAGVSKMKLLYKISQTPQVLIDCQLSVQTEGTLINWDLRAGVYADEVINQMFSAFQSLLLILAKQQSRWSEPASISLPETTVNIRQQINQTALDYPAHDLFAGIYQSMLEHPDNQAIISDDLIYSYRDLADHVARIQNQLNQIGIASGDPIGILLGKGIWQIAAVLAVVSLGGAYVPIDCSQPRSRQEMILSQAGIKIIITDHHAKEELSQSEISTIKVDEIAATKQQLMPKYLPIAPHQTAYIIFTSGSTGVPKGVVISHEAATNTIDDIIHRFNVSNKDRVLGVSNLYFDLSVFDIFGILSVAGTLVLPTHTQQAEVSHWATLVRKYEVTIFNMVPAQMNMYLAYIDSASNQLMAEQKLRLIMLSGDWIPVPMAGKIRQLYPHVESYSLGGATEAAIWSIYYPIELVESTASSVPYGLPLANQQFYILDQHQSECPDWVTGEICIAGKGLAKEYLKSPELTDEKFIIAKQLNRRIYRTGDLGRYRPDGVIEFLGRQDSQVKVNGYRIELGEIESSLNRHPEITNTVVLKTAKNQLKAFVQPIYKDLKIVPKITETVDENAYLTASFDHSTFASWVQLADQTAVYYILKTLTEAGVLGDTEHGCSISQIQLALRLKPQYHQLLQRWLSALMDFQLIKKEADRYYPLYHYQSGDAENVEAKWLAIDQQVNYSQTLLQYIHTASIQLRQVLAGDVHPHHLLFPQGSFEIEFAAYKDNVVTKVINHVLRDKVIKMAQEKNDQGQKIRILDVGAGIGGATMELIDQLHGYHVDYYYTDISNFFFNAAKSFYPQTPWIEYRLYDINKENWEQGFAEEKFDLIICANVLHNANNIKKALISLTQMLNSTGVIAVLEEVQKRYALLTSVEFEFAEAASSYQDGRDESDSIFIGFEQWQQLVAELNGQIQLTFPEPNHRLYPSGQCLFFAEFNHHQTITAGAIKNYLSTCLPEYMIPAEIVIMDHFPLTSNGKIDRKKLSTEVRQTSHQDSVVAKTQPSGELERQIATIWSEVIGTPNIGRDDDFYAIGGDSLLIAQVTSKMLNELDQVKGWEWDRLMLEIMKNATVAELAKKISEKVLIKPKQKEKITPLVVFKEAEQELIQVKALFHAGTGTLSSYRELLPYLLEHCHQHQSLVGFSFGDAEDFLNRSPETLIHECARIYANILAALNAAEYELIGYCVGGWIALETAKILVEQGKNVRQVISISSSLSGHDFDHWRAWF